VKKSGRSQAIKKDRILQRLRTLVALMRLKPGALLFSALKPSSQKVDPNY
jgi:hypothetical protein